MSSLPENHPWMILLRPAHCLLEFNILARHWKVPQNSILVAYRTNHALDSQIAEYLPKYSSTPSTVLSGQNVYVLCIKICSLIISDNQHFQFAAGHLARKELLQIMYPHNSAFNDSYRRSHATKRIDHVDLHHKSKIHWKWLEMGMNQNLLYHIGGDEHPFTSYFKIFTRAFHRF